MDVLKEYDETWKILCVLRDKSHNYFYCCRKKSSLRRNLKLFEQKYFPKRFPHKISSKAIKNGRTQRIR